MATSNSPDVVVQVRRAGEDGRVKVLASFQNNGPEPAQNQAFEWFHKNLPFSFEHATTREGYTVVEVWGDGSEHVTAGSDRVMDAYRKSQGS